MENKDKELNEKQITRQVNNISDELQKNYKIVRNTSWRLVIVTMIVTFAIVMFVILYDAYSIKNNQLMVEANKINNVINKEFSMVVNSINMNGYITTFEQYLKTTADDENIVESIYYEPTLQSLNMMSMISEEIESVFVVSFANSSVLYSGISNVYNEKYDYKNQPWYNYNQIMKNSAYLSEEFAIREGDDEALFGIVRPILDSMSDEPLGVVVYAFNSQYLDKVFSDSIKDNKSDAVVRIAEGKILYSTKDFGKEGRNQAFIESYISKDYNIVYRLDNENLNWNIISYCTVLDVFKNSFAQFAVVIAIFILLAITFNMFIRRLKFIKVVRTRSEIKKILDLEKIQVDENNIDNSLEDIQADDYMDMPIEEVLSSSEK